MARKKAKKQPRKVTPRILGTGAAAKTGATLRDRRAMQMCEATGGRWVSGVGCRR